MLTTAKINGFTQLPKFKLSLATSLSQFKILSSLFQTDLIAHSITFDGIWKFAESVMASIVYAMVVFSYEESNPQLSTIKLLVTEKPRSVLTKFTITSGRTLQYMIYEISIFWKITITWVATEYMKYFWT